ncbi:50S ribosomal protein L19e [Candidatus Woesearchaeota archaeon]|nr:50S ribosomal protein L19e [Candidatus Woesearchaeota archaeon]
MDLKVQKRLAAEAMKCSQKRVSFDESRLDEIKEAITKADIRALISKGAIQLEHKSSKSSSRIKKAKEQKRKGKRKGHGSRKGKKTARSPKKKTWMNRIRAQRKLLRSLKKGDRIDIGSYRDLYSKCKGGFFRSIRHIKVYIEEREIIKKNEKKQDT